MKFLRTFRALLIIQIFLYIAGMVVYYIGERQEDGSASYASILPFGLFMIFGVINGVYFVLYLTKISSKVFKHDSLVTALLVFLACLFVAYPFLIPALSKPWEPPSGNPGYEIPINP